MNVLLEPITAQCEILDFGSDIERVHSFITCVGPGTLFVSTNDLRLFSLFCIIKPPHRSEAHENGRNKP
ncbi:hypothetical protein J6590_104503 [Homalodisca vitripennis]|nr:hypothetical protein J6590_104503 [Homalodisca vitripennis]